jgi:hypothetical protein
MYLKIKDHVAQFADVDTRRALGVFGRVSIPDLKLQPPTLWRYWPAQKKAIFFCADPYEFEVHTGLVFDGNLWIYEEGARISAVWRKRSGKYVFSEHNTYHPLDHGFSFGENPQFITE